MTTVICSFYRTVKGFVLDCVLLLRHTHGYLYSTRGSCVSLFICAVSLWGWLVHGTSLKIDICSPAKRRLTKEWERMKAHEGARKCDWDIETETKGLERKKESQCKCPLHHTCASRKHTYTSCESLKWRERWKINISGEGNQADSKNMNGGECRQHGWWTQSYKPWYFRPTCSFDKITKFSTGRQTC